VTAVTLLVGEEILLRRRTLVPESVRITLHAEHSSKNQQVLGFEVLCQLVFQHFFDMWITCKYAYNMSKMIQLRNVPDVLHRLLKARAAMAGMSLSDYLLAEIKGIAERPTLAELQQRLHKRKPISVEFDSASLVRDERESR